MGRDHPLLTGPQGVPGALKTKGGTAEAIGSPVFCRLGLEREAGQSCQCLAKAKAPACLPGQGKASASLLCQSRPLVAYSSSLFALSPRPRWLSVCLLPPSSPSQYLILWCSPGSVAFEALILSLFPSSLGVFVCTSVPPLDTFVPDRGSQSSQGLHHNSRGPGGRPLGEHGWQRP